MEIDTTNGTPLIFVFFLCIILSIVYFIMCCGNIFIHRIGDYKCVFCFSAIIKFQFSQQKTGQKRPVLKYPIKSNHNFFHEAEHSFEPRFWVIVDCEFSTNWNWKISIMPPTGAFSFFSTLYFYDFRFACHVIFESVSSLIQVSS